MFNYKLECFPMAGLSSLVSYLWVRKELTLEKGTWVGSGLTRKHQTRLERPNKDNSVINYRRKSFITLGQVRCHNIRSCYAQWGLSARGRGGV